MESNDIDQICLTLSENCRFDSLLFQLKGLESVIKFLQDEGTSMSDVRGLFDAVIEKYPETEIKLT